MYGLGGTSVIWIQTQSSSQLLASYSDRHYGEKSQGPRIRMLVKKRDEPAGGGAGNNTSPFLVLARVHTMGRVWRGPDALTSALTTGPSPPQTSCKQENICVRACCVSGLWRGETQWESTDLSSPFISVWVCCRLCSGIPFVTLLLDLVLLWSKSEFIIKFWKHFLGEICLLTVLTKKAASHVVSVMLPGNRRKLSEVTAHNKQTVWHKTLR